jgi:cysteinyl-tRNA synthetase
MADIQVFNTLTAKKEIFKPLSGKIVKIYDCGPTVYDLSHLGHARTFIVWDVVQRYFRHAGYDVTYVRNVTDVDDKIINRARERGINPDQLARQFTFEFWRDMKALNVLPPDFEPRATEYISRMVDFAQKLVSKGFAYESSGDVYFDVAKFKDYGKLGKQNLEQLMHGAREQIRSQEELKAAKKSPLDFALWKHSDQNDLGWDSPWGRGRPGWHLECSTMIKHVLGESIDIHSGGEDLVFPHHENEIAQSESLHGKPLAKYWMHNGFIQVSAEKMSKSLGNFQTIQDLLVNYSADTIRLLILQTHYRNPIEFTAESLIGAKTAVSRLVRAVSFDPSDSAEKIDFKQSEDLNIKSFAIEFEEAMNNDFNTAIAISTLFAFADKIQQADEQTRPAYAQALKAYANLLGLQLDDKRRVLDTTTASRIMDLVVELRQSAREKKDYATSDLIRKQLTELKINIMDIAGGGTDWEKL